MLGALTALVHAEIPNCEACDSPRDLHLWFELGLNRGKRECIALTAFLPEKTLRKPWREKDGSLVEFFPFMVVLNAIGGKKLGKYYWLPYWHVVTNRPGKRKEKYGQWAPFLGHELFESLVSQARRGGHDIAALCAGPVELV
jgi:hypothetical protein